MYSFYYYYYYYNYNYCYCYCCCYCYYYYLLHETLAHTWEFFAERGQLSGNGKAQVPAY